jgi:hypothetical protein
MHRLTLLSIGLLSLALASCNAEHSFDHLAQTGGDGPGSPGTGGGPGGTYVPGTSNLRPTCRDRVMTTEFNSRLEFILGTSDDVSDANDAFSTLRITVPRSGSNGGVIAIANASARKYSYVPVTGFRGTESFLYRVADPKGAFTECTVTVGVESSVRLIRPALAVRATGCIMCHAQVRANVVTDFGYGGDGQGTDYYFGGGSLAPYSGAIYGDHSENWQTAKVWGNVIVPRVMGVPGSATISLADYLRATVTSPEAGVPAPTVMEKSAVHIGVPSSAKILAAAGGFAAAQPLYKYIPHSAASGALEGLEVVAGPGGSYLRNTAGTELRCYGDLVVKGVLFLQGAQLRTDNAGCRIYSTHTVFIQGGITHLGAAETRNLQITSARGIYLGFGRGSGLRDSGRGLNADNSLVNRLQGIFTRTGYYTREQGKTVQQKNDDVVADSALLGDALIDASNLPGGRAVELERLFLNAPRVESRYLGNFKGVVVAEMAMFSLGNFVFEFDDVFTKVPVLPLVSEQDFLAITE